MAAMHPAGQGALAALLGLEADLAVVGEAGDGGEAEELVRALVPHVLVTDREMPLRIGLEFAQAVKDLPIRVVILTTFGRSGYLRRALEAGALGYLLNDAPSAELADAIRRVARGLRAIDPQLAAQAWGEDGPLTDRERQVLRLAGDGRSGPEIAAALGLAEGTVRNYLSEAISKLGASNRVEAARRALEQGW